MSRARPFVYGAGTCVQRRASSPAIAIYVRSCCSASDKTFTPFFPGAVRRVERERRVPVVRRRGQYFRTPLAECREEFSHYFDNVFFCKRYQDRYFGVRSRQPTIRDAKHSPDGQKSLVRPRIVRIARAKTPFSRTTRARSRSTSPAHGEGALIVRSGLSCARPLARRLHTPKTHHRTPANGWARVMVLGRATERRQRDGDGAQPVCTTVTDPQTGVAQDSLVTRAAMCVRLVDVRITCGLHDDAQLAAVFIDPRAK